MSEIRTNLLSELIAHKGDFVSGSVLSEKAGVSRVSIKKHMDHLSESGVEIEAVRNRGYCLKQLPLRFHEDTYRFYLGDAIPESSVFCFDAIDSTNLELDRRLNAGEPAPMLAIAASQSKGKGRRGNQWMSRTGENLYLSMGFRPNLPVSRIGQYTLWVGMQLAKTLREQLGLEVMVKWPNDLYLDDKKLAGILTEAKIDTDHVQHLIVGLGLNVNADHRYFEGELEQKATSLRMVSGNPLEFNQLAATISKSLLAASEAYFDASRSAEITEQWDSYDFLAGKNVQARSGRGDVMGVAAGIDESGELQIRLADQTLCTVNSGEVTMAFEKS